MFFLVLFGSFFYGSKKTQAAKEKSIWYLKTINKFEEEKKLQCLMALFLEDFFVRRTI